MGVHTRRIIPPFFFLWPRLVHLSIPGEVVDSSESPVILHWGFVQRQVSPNAVALSVRKKI
jgi:hypothetical protein